VNTIYTLYCPMTSSESVAMLVTGDRYTYSIIEEQDLKAAMAYLVSRNYAEKPIVNHGNKLATFTDWEDLITKHPELLL